MRFDLLPSASPEQVLSDAMANGLDVQGYSFTGDAGSVDLYRLSLDRCLFRDCNLTGCSFACTTISDVRFEHCDLSGVCFDDAGLHRVQFHDCRALGAHFSGALWEDVVLTGSLFDYGNFSHAEWRHCTLNGSFRDAALTDLTVKRTLTDGCDFTRADWSHAQISGLDLSGANIEGTIFSLEGLSGVIVSQAQALELSKLLGLVIRNG